MAARRTGLSIKCRRGKVTMAAHDPLLSQVSPDSSHWTSQDAMAVRYPDHQFAEAGASTLTGRRQRRQDHSSIAVSNPANLFKPCAASVSAHSRVVLGGGSEVVAHFYECRNS